MASTTTDYIAWKVTDCWNNVCTGVVEEGYDNALVCGLQNPQGYAISFDSDFNHLKDWCDRNGVELITEKGQHEFKN